MIKVCRCFVILIPYFIFINDYVLNPHSFPQISKALIKLTMNVETTKTQMNIIRKSEKHCLVFNTHFRTHTEHSI